jgi:hypothetical protein
VLSQTPPTFIRTNDALHLASAKVAEESEFITADIRQRAAAVLMGFHGAALVRFSYPSQRLSSDGIAQRQGKAGSASASERVGP